MNNILFEENYLEKKEERNRKKAWVFTIDIAFL